ncbi:MAG: indolepyruvate oxidoreductase subunit beta family protein [Rhodospirillales bacterium]|nr:indolepyruvate oxidoreductase subunit beta family protein [Rhodospirillales bacterium]MDE2197498.1 indolepyruvate oxidoreductase subunit beta family protein [Rhodospirillales bacterium]
MSQVTTGLDEPISVAIVAMGGQGGGVLADWIVAMAEQAGWVAQATSVPGVAQRTGATIYYVEMVQGRAGSWPVLSLMPVPGHVDIVIAAELMEAGRAIQRGLVSPERTTLVASTHRSYSMLEKARAGDGRAPSAPVLETARALSHQLVAADMQAIAEGAGSVISAALFGGLAASGRLPFGRDAFEATIRASGVGVAASLRAFSTAFEASLAAPAPLPAAAEPARPAMQGGSKRERAVVEQALARVAAQFPPDAQPMLHHGLRRLVDYQDGAYALEYLDRVARFAARDGLPAHALIIEAARQIAVAMSYDDVIRVADLKTRATRTARVHADILAAADQVVETTEFMHPRVAEICATLPAAMGGWIEGSPALSGLVRRLFEKPRRVRTSRLWGFLQLYLVAGLRPWRRRLLRHQREQAHIEGWLTLALAQNDPALTLEILKCRRLVKGYSDTHARGESRFDRVLAALSLLAGRPDAAEWVRRLREAALADETGRALDGALATVASL